jgi:2-polyprenyl-3-methyl-5-hydroxy-6-metoxy-1,4-benzoquinol methylase
MGALAVQTRRECWCGNRQLGPFSVDYRVCKSCGTLVSQAGLADDGYLVNNDDADFYGKQYWLGHQAQELGLPQIQDRARLDLPERCLYWLRHVLAYVRPQAKVLELGSAHGGFVALLRLAGYDATGLEMSPWVAQLARDIFGVPMLVGPVEQQGLEPGSYDAVVAHDVMEHLPDPLGTLGAAVKLLKPNGVLFIQMPEYPDGRSCEDLLADKDRFLEHTKEPTEHLYLYSKRAAQAALRRLGLTCVQFHRPLFDYDMYFVAGRQPRQACSLEDLPAQLTGTPQARVLLALLDKCNEVERYVALWHASEKDRADRLSVINDIGAKLEASQVDCDARLKAIQFLQAHVKQLETRLADSDADRAARLHAVVQLEKQLAASEADRSNRLQAITRLEQQLAATDADRAARLRTIAELSRTLLASDEDRTARLRVILEQEKLLQEQQSTISAQARALELLRAAGLGPQPPLWKWLPKKLAKIVLPAGLRRAIRAQMAPRTAPDRHQGLLPPPGIPGPR